MDLSSFAGFGLLMGHLLGDYVFQNDWMSGNKTNPHPGPLSTVAALPDGSLTTAVGPEHQLEQSAWIVASEKYGQGHVACTVHCLVYTLCVWICSCWWLPLWALPAIFISHWPMDRFRLASWWMKNVSGQKTFATGALSPWSVILVDNIYHLLVLFAIGLISLCSIR